MPKSTDKSRPKRRYDNRGREKQAAKTKAAILQALARQLVTHNSTDFSIADAAKEAGVTTRTLFRYFPTKELMLEAVSQWVLGITGQIPIPESPEQLGETVVSTYRMFEDHADLMRALLLSDLGRGVRSNLASRRRQGLSDALEEAVQGLPRKRAQAVKALVVHNLTAEAWWHMRDAFGVKGDESAEVVAWMVRLVLDALNKGEHPFGEVLKKNPSA